MIHRTCIALGLVLAATATTAAPIYRCGNTYSQTPCPEGGTVVEATDPRTGAQRAEARRLAAAERKAAAEREREQKEKAAENAAATAVPGTLSPAAAAPATPPASAAHARAGHAKPKKAAADKDFVAAVPRDKAARK